MRFGLKTGQNHSINKIAFNLSLTCRLNCRIPGPFICIRITSIVFWFMPPRGNDRATYSEIAPTSVLVLGAPKCIGEFDVPAWRLRLLQYLIIKVATGLIYALSVTNLLPQRSQTLFCNRLSGIGFLEKMSLGRQIFHQTALPLFVRSLFCSFQTYRSGLTVSVTYICFERELKKEVFNS